MDSWWERLKEEAAIHQVSKDFNTLDSIDQEKQKLRVLLRHQQAFLQFHKGPSDLELAKTRSVDFET